MEEFQYKIGRYSVWVSIQDWPNFGHRFTIDAPKPFLSRDLGPVKSGDINIFFPRRDGTGGDRGGYIVQLTWHFNRVDGSFQTEAGMSKEIPHGEYAKRNQFLVKVPDILSQTNPRANLENPIPIPIPDPESPEEKLNIMDEQWHSILAIAYNDLYFRFEPNNPEDPTTGNLKGSPEWLPVIGLWYSDTPTTDFNDFTFLGMGMDLGNMSPRGPLREEIGDDDHPIIDFGDILDVLEIDSFDDFLDPLNDIFIPGAGTVINLFSDNAVGDDLFRAEHALQIRIDDVPLNEIEITNVYAASVRHIGIRPPQGLPLCGAEAKAVNDAQTIIDQLKRERDELSRDLSDLTGSALEERKSQIEAIDKGIRRRKCDRHAAEFNYLKCNPKRIDVFGGGGPTVLNCEPFERAVVDAQNMVKGWEMTIEMLELQREDFPPGHPERVQINEEIAKIKNTHLPKAKVALNAAKKAFDDCISTPPVINPGPT
jgi:hypothetical protein